jgi:hypothetical protein
MSRGPAGWFVDKTNPRIERRWDGSRWSGETRPVHSDHADHSDAPESNSGLFPVPDVPGDPLFDQLPGPSSPVDLEDILVGPPRSSSLRLAAADPDGDGNPELARRDRKSRTLMNVAALIAVLLVVGGGTFLYVGRNTSADAAVALALTSTLANKTADLTVTGNVGVGSAGVDVTGTGAVNFTQNAAELALNTSVHGNQVTENEVTVGDTIYLNLGALVSQEVPGKSWISLDLGQLNQGGSASPLGIGGGLSTNNPAAILKILGQRGNTVTGLGQSTINGTTVQGYEVEVNPADVRAEIAAAHLPSWMQQSVSTSGNLDISYKVFIGGNGTLYRLTTDLAVPVDGQSLNGVISMDFSNFGTPTTIAAPPAEQVAPYQAFLQKF